MDFKDGVGKVKVFFFFFLTAHSFRGLELSYLNLIKLVYKTLLASDFRAWPMSI